MIPIAIPVRHFLGGGSYSSDELPKYFDGFPLAVVGIAVAVTIGIFVFAFEHLLTLGQQVFKPLHEFFIADLIDFKGSLEFLKQGLEVERFYNHELPAWRRIDI